MHRDPKQFGVCINLTVGVGIRMDGDVLGFGGELGTIDRLRHQVVDRHQFSAADHIGGLQTGKFDNIADQRGQPLCFFVQTTREIVDRFRVIAGFFNGFCEQANCPYRSFQLMRNVRHEVVAYPLHTRDFGAVIGEHQNIFVSHRSHAQVDNQEFVLAPGYLKFFFHENTAVPHGADHLGKLN